jgi:hypothetical protein
VEHEELEPQEDLLRYFEKVSNRPVRTREDLENYLGFVDEVKPQWLHVNRAARGWPLAQRIVLVVLFGFAVVQYYVVDVIAEIASLRGTTYFVPPAGPDARSAAARPDRA